MPSHTALRAEDVIVGTTGGGQIRAHDLAHARQVVAHAAAHAAAPVLTARVRLVHQRDPALRRPYSAQANLDVNGRTVRAHTTATTVGQAIDALDDRLRGQIQRLGRYGEHRVADRRPDAGTTPGRQRAGADRTPRRVIRHKTYALCRASIDDAAWDMDLMDYDFHLFTEASTGRDTVVYRAGPTGYRLAQAHARPGWVPPARLPVTVSPIAAPHLTLAAAIDLLEATGRPFQFYVVASGRGRVLYRRHDGDYGLITTTDLPAMS